MPKIVIVITRSDIGGAQNHVLSLIEAFRHQYEIVLVTGSNGFLSDAVKKLGITVHFLFDIDSFNAFKAVHGLKKIFNKEQPDLVHTHSSLASFYGRAAAKMCNKKVLYTVHGWHFAGERNPIKWCIKVGLELCARMATDYWLTVSNFDRQLGDKFHLFKANKVVVIANGISDIALPSRGADVNRSNDSLEVVFVGRSTYQKNCDCALDVLKEAHENVNLTIFASGGQVANLQASYSKSPAKYRIRLILDEPEAAMQLHKFDLMLITSRYEGMPLGVLEAMRASLPIVSTNVCGMNELVKEGVNGYLFEQEDIQGMAQKLNDYAQDRLSVETMGEASRAIYLSRFTLDKMMQSTAQVYSRLINSK